VTAGGTAGGEVRRVLVEFLNIFYVVEKNTWVKTNSRNSTLPRNESAVVTASITSHHQRAVRAP
jgi:hypothetical protein